MHDPLLDQVWPAHRLIEGWWSRCTSGGGQVLPDGAIDLIIVEGQTAMLAGPDTLPMPVTLPAGSRVLGVRLRIGVASAVFGESARSFQNQRVPLPSLAATPVIEQLRDSLGQSETDAGRATAVADFITTLLPATWEPDPVVAAQIDRITHGRLPTVTLSSRQQRRRFTDSVGYGPKMFERIARLNRFQQLAQVAPRTRPLGQLAAEAGYFDEAHAHRDTRLLADCTPGELVRR